jgi:hypothetical protein
VKECRLKLCLGKAPRTKIDTIFPEWQ